MRSLPLHQVGTRMKIGTSAISVAAMPVVAFATAHSDSDMPNTGPMTVPTTNGPRAVRRLTAQPTELHLPLSVTSKAKHAIAVKARICVAAKMFRSPRPFS